MFSKRLAIIGKFVFYVRMETKMAWIAFVSFVIARLKFGIKDKVGCTFGVL
jgi:hypothetical protein